MFRGIFILTIAMLLNWKYALLVEGDSWSIFKLDNGQSAFCREIEDCPEMYTYTGQCQCEPPQICCIHSGKAKAKCQEYGKYVYRLDYAASLMVQGKLENISQCHVEAVPLIVGGVKADAKEFPHMVALGYGEKPDMSWMCGGSLISEQHVLSAAHCKTSRDLGPVRWAKLGILDVNETDDPAQEFNITERIVHPSYKPPSRYNDIAIFKLDKAAIMNGYVRPACLNVEASATFKTALATGWGKLEYVAARGSDSLMKVLLNIIDYERCNYTYKVDVGGKAMYRGVSESQICAGELDKGKDTCQGDSGGPLQTVLESPHCMYSVIGVTSFGKFCGFKNAPALYTKVSHFIPWIESIVWPN